MNTKIYFTICFMSLLSWALCAQNGNVGIGTTDPDSSAMLDVSSKNKGLLVPHVKLRAINDSTSPINRPANGLLIYHTGENSGIEMGFYYWNGHEWVGLCSCPAARFGVEILPNNISVCQGSGDVTLTANATGASSSCSYSWNNGSGTTSNDATLNVATTYAGEYTYTVTANDNGHSVSDTATVTVNPNPEVTVTPPIDAGCVPINSVTLTASCTSDNTGLTYAWHASTGQDLSGGSITVTPSVSTTYTVTATDGNGCSSTASTSVNVRNILGQITEFTVNGVSFNTVPVRGGTFLMGATRTMSELNREEDDAQNDEQPVHQVTLSSYAIGQTEVTQALWQAVMGNYPSYYAGDDRANHPVDSVSWNDICGETGFLKRLNDSLERQRCGMEFVLPTEAQWEYAAAGGRNGYEEGNSRIHKYSGSDTVDVVSWYSGNAGSTTHVVGAACTGDPCKRPNELGLYDMSGNVWEWCSDWYSADYYENSPSENPENTTLGHSYNRVIRGGGWDAGADRSRVAFRYYTYYTSSGDYLGFRLALVQNRSSN